MVRVEYNTARAAWDMYKWSPVERDGIHYKMAATTREGRPYVEEVPPGGQMPVYLSIEDEDARVLCEAVMRDHPVEVVRDTVSRADDATKDARDTRDRLLAMLERVNTQRGL